MLALIPAAQAFKFRTQDGTIVCAANKLKSAEETVFKKPLHAIEVQCTKSLGGTKYRVFSLTPSQRAQAFLFDYGRAPAPHARRVIRPGTTVSFRLYFDYFKSRYVRTRCTLTAGDRPTFSCVAGKHGFRLYANGARRLW